MHVRLVVFLIFCLLRNTAGDAQSWKRDLDSARMTYAQDPVAVIACFERAENGLNPDSIKTQTYTSCIVDWAAAYESRR
jgi:hypothetical protein